MKKGLLIGGIVGAVIAAVVVTIRKNKQLTETAKNVTKYLGLFRQMNQYLVTKQMNKSIVDYFKQRGIKTIGIYGMSHIAQRIIDDLEKSDIKVLYGIDRRADRLTYDLEIYRPEEEYPEVDAIVVTAYDFEEVSDMLSEKVECEIISFADMIFNL